MHHPPHAAGQRGAGDDVGAPDVDLGEVGRAAGVDHAGRVDDVDRPGEPGEEVGDTRRPTDVADDDVEPGRRRQRGPVGVVGHEGTDAAGAGVGAVTEQVVEEGPAEPAGGAGDDRDVRWLDERHQWARLVVSTKRRALRMANAMTEPCGLTPGASGSSEASLT